ncbi:hypothetical protein ACVWXO_001806 [Bradyrhizobium sp. LM2.7]
MNFANCASGTGTYVEPYCHKAQTIWPSAMLQNQGQKVVIAHFPLPGSTSNMLRGNCDWRYRFRIMKPRPNTRPRRQEHAPPDAVFNAVEELFELAKNGMPDPKNAARAALRYRDRDGDPSIEAIRQAVGLQPRWSFWSLASWQYGDRLSQQRRFANLLIDFFSGTFERDHFSDTKVREEAEAIVGHLRRMASVKLDQAIKVLTNYSSDLLRRQMERESPKESGHPVLVTVASQIPTPHANGTKYCGAQNDETHEQTAALCRSFKSALENPDANGPPLGLFTLNFELRSQYTRGPALRSQKEALYGGIPDAPLKLTPLDFAASELTFDRTLAAEVYLKIVNCPANFSSYSILSYPGQGKSIVLAQVLLRLSATPGYWSFWSFDVGKSFKCEDSEQCVERFYRLMRQSECVPRRQIFIFDALDRRSQTDFDAIFDFHSYCEKYSNRNGAEISFLFSSSDLERSLTDDTFELSLDKRDETRLYEAMLAAEPRMAAKAYDTIDEMLRTCPLIHSWKNDVQSATDYIIQNSKPIRDFTPNWFSDLNDETELAQRALTVIAVSTLLDLALPDHIAHELSEPNREQAIFARKAGALVSSSRRIAYRKIVDTAGSGEWPGYVLKSPYYASSLLQRLKRLNEAFVKETIMRMFDCSLTRAEHNMLLWKATDAEFIRHLFHRLAKRKVNRLSGFSDGTRIAAELFASYGDRLLRVLQSQKSAADLSNWAGTFSYLLVPGSPRRFNGDTTTTEQMIYNLCSSALKENRVIQNSQTFVTLLLAIRALCDPYAGEKKIKDLADTTEQMFDLARVLDSVGGDSSAEAERRANQVVLSYAKFLRRIPDRKLHEKCRTISSVYEHAEERFLATGFRLDAPNWLERAEVVWIRRADSASIARRARYLQEARAATELRPQLKYKAEVERSITKFEMEYRRAIHDFA